MPSSRRFSITLPEEMAHRVRAKVASGEYASESEMIKEGLRALLSHDGSVESWLHDWVAPAYDAVRADPSRARTLDEVRGVLAAEHRKKLVKS